MKPRPTRTFHKKDPGVPEAIPETIHFVRDTLGVDALDDLWIFPPLVQGRRERGLVVVSAFRDDDRRAVHTVTYAAERTGIGLTVEPRMAEEGVAPTDRIPRMISGVVRRARQDLGEPRNVRIAGEPDRLDALLEELLAQAEAVS